MVGFKVCFSTHRLKNKWTKTFCFMEIVFLSLFNYISKFLKRIKDIQAVASLPHQLCKPKINILKNMYNSWIMKAINFESAVV